MDDLEAYQQEKGIESYSSQNKVDMGVIERIKKMRGDKRSDSISLNKKREETIKEI